MDEVHGEYSLVLCLIVRNWQSKPVRIMQFAKIV